MASKDVRSGRKGRRGSKKPEAPSSKGASKLEVDEPKKSRRERAAERRRAVKPGGAKGKSQSGAQKERRGGFVRFVGECAAELRKVDWPGQRQLIAGTVAVLIAVTIVGVYLYAADEALSRLVRDVLLAG